MKGKKSFFTKRILTAIILGCMMMMFSGISVLAAGTITPTHLNDFQSGKGNVQNIGVTLGMGQTQTVLPVKMNYPGKLVFEISSGGTSGYVTFYLFADAACTNQVGNSGSIGSNSLTDVMNVNVPRAGTYYLRVSRSSYASESQVSFNIKPYSYSGLDKVMKNNSWVGTYGLNYDKTIYHKITVTKTGYIRVQGYGEGSQGARNGINVMLYDAKKRSVSTSEFMYGTNAYSAYFGVKKGTYYVGVKNGGQYKLKYNLYGVSEKSGSKKSKAVTVGKNRIAKGLAIAGESGRKVDWYKIKLTKKQKLNLYFSVKSNDAMKFTVVPANRRVTLLRATQYVSTGSKSTRSRQALPAGTYYIQVSRFAGNGDTSGYYTFKYK